MATRRQQLETFLDKEVKKLLVIIEELNRSGKGAIVEGVSSELTDAKKKALMDAIKQSAVITDSKVKDWLIPAVSGNYVAGLNATDLQVSKFGFDTKGGKITVQVLRTAPEMKPHLEAVNALLSDAYLDFGTGITGWIKGNEHILNDVVRRQVQSKIGLGRLTGEAVADIKKEVTGLLQSQGFQALIDRGGHQWTLERYSEMLARTHLIKANTESNVNRLNEFGVDIVEVSTHGTTDEVCLEFEGNLYSLSGKSENYPQLPQQPPFHPNCKHSLQPRPDLQ